MPDKMPVEPIAVLPEEKARVRTTMQALLEQLESNRVRHYAIDTGTAEVSIAIHPDDIGTLRRACRTLEQVRLIRAEGTDGESRIILEDTANGKRRYSAIRVVPTANDPEIARSRRYLSGVALGLFRWVRAWLRPDGLFCVVLGPDGVGKSTTVRHLQLELQTLFGSCKKQRWRPGIIRKIAPDSSNRMPHSKPLRGRIKSTLFVFGLALDFSLGYAVSTYPAMARCETIIFDRYFHDILIDPRRYRYSGSMWLAQFLSRLTPPRNALFIILDAHEDVILSRKQELTPHELRRQLGAYRTFGTQAPGSMIITTDKPVDETVAEIIDKILDVLASRNGNGSRYRERAVLNLT
ncbi:hypothetical protein [Alloacidobacterium sp.]|uniref:hypothetical protein n=1 Tax=Alloacidobacterium sp. TaxID=2951999 RepID=UPI002D30BEB4|nr:hypothetical protein [Alloacidobacterium sp.]HYK36747.1 hypothetical protein [Alloacidobacterium sp.]